MEMQLAQRFVDSNFSEDTRDAQMQKAQDMMAAATEAMTTASAYLDTNWEG